MNQRPIDNPSTQAEVSWVGIAWRAIYLIGLQVILLQGFWLTVFRSGVARALDGSTHYATASIFNRTIYPDIFGWTHAFMGGMPLSNYYPPLLFWLTSLLAHLGVGFDVAFKLIAIVPTLFIVPCLWLLAYRMFNKRVAFWTAVFGFFQMLIPQLNASLQWPSGLDYVSTFSVGYYAESLGFVLLVCWYVLYMGRKWTPGRHLLAGLLLASVVLASYLAVIASAVMIVTTLAFDAVGGFLRKRRGDNHSEKNEGEYDKRALFHHFLNPAAAVGLSACWTVPVIATYTYVVTRPFHQVFVTVPLLVAQCCAVLGGYLAWRRASKAARPFIVVCVGLSLLTLFAALAPRWFPMQGNRLAVFVRFLATVLVGVTISRGVEVARRASRKLIPLKLSVILRRWSPFMPQVGAAVGLLIIFLLAASPGMKMYARGGLNSGFYPGGNLPGGVGGTGAQAILDYGAHQGEQSLQGLLQFARKHTDGSYLVAIPDESQVDFPSLDAMAMSAYLGAQGNEALYCAYREASVNALYDYPQVAAFSANDEPSLRFGISSTLSDDLDFRDQPLSVHLDRLRWLGVRYVVVYDEVMKNRLRGESMASEAEKFGPWSIFALKGAAPPFAQPLQNRPALVISDFSAKLRRSDEHNFLRLAEEQFADNWFDVPLVRSPIAAIDLISEKTLDQFGALIVEKYDDDDFFAAYERLKWFARTRPVILLPRDERLFNRISSTLAEFPHATILDSVPEESGVFLESLWGPTRHYAQSGIRHEWRQIRQLLEHNKISVASAGGRSELVMGRDQSSLLAFSIPSLAVDETVPVLLRMTYHPRWTMADGSQIYAATPFYSLVFAKSGNQLIFRRNGVDRLGVALSALSLLALTIWPMLVWLRNVLHRAGSTMRGEVSSGRLRVQ